MKLAELRRSLTLRVTLVFVLIVALVSAGLGMHLYRSFVAEILGPLADDVEGARIAE